MCRYHYYHYNTNYCSDNNVPCGSAALRDIWVADPRAMMISSNTFPNTNTNTNTSTNSNGNNSVDNKLTKVMTIICRQGSSTCLKRHVTGGEYTRRLPVLRSGAPCVQSCVSTGACGRPGSRSGQLCQYTRRLPVSRGGAVRLKTEIIVLTASKQW